MTKPGRTLAAAFAPALVLLSLALAACGAARAPQPTATVPAALTSAPAPTRTPAVLPTAVIDPTPTTPVPAASAPASGNLPPGWQQETNAQLSIAIPPGWRVINLSGADAQAVFDGLAQNDPLLAGIIGGPDALTGAAFWAFGPVEGEFVDNLNVRRSPLGSARVTNLQQVIDVLLPEYEKMGLQVTSSDATLHVDKWPAARVTYTVNTSTASGAALELRGRQVIVATDTDLWILSFSTAPEREGAMAAEFEMSAQSFRPK